MSTPTANAVYTQNSSQSLSTVAGAWPQVAPNGIAAQNLDLLQIVGIGGTNLVNVTYNGTVNFPAVSPTDGTRIGVFFSRLTSSATLAQIFADAFSENNQRLDIIQVRNSGGNIHYNLNYQGVASGS